MANWSEEKCLVSKCEGTCHDQIYLGELTIYACGKHYQMYLDYAQEGVI